MLIISISPFCASEICPFIFIRLSYSQHKNAPVHFILPPLSTIFVPTMKKFADVILPLPLHSCFTYSLPDEWADEVQIGCRVVVPFGRKKYYTAIVRNVHYCAPPNTK